MTADDVIFVSSRDDQHQNKNLELKMNSALDIRNFGAKDNNMTIGRLKTVYQFFTLSHKNLNLNLKVEDELLEKNVNTNYLGVQLGNKLIWKEQGKSMATKSNNRRVMKRLSGAKWGCTPSILLTMHT